MNPDKLKELSEGAQRRIRALAERVKEEMGEKFVKVYLTSVHRDVKSQINILMNKLISAGGTKNMFEYYEARIGEGLDELNGIPRDVGRSGALNYISMHCRRTLTGLNRTIGGVKR